MIGFLVLKNDAILTDTMRYDENNVVLTFRLS